MPVVLPKVDLHPVETEMVVEGAKRGGNAADSGAIALSRAAVIALTPTFADADAELKLYLENEWDTYRFHLVTFYAGFQPAKAEAFTRAALRVGMSNDDGEAPIIWSALPTNADDDYELSEEVAVGADLKLLSADAKSSLKDTESEPYIRVSILQEPHLTWTFTPTRSTALDKSHKLRVVTRSRVGTTARGKVDLRVSIRKRMFFVLPKSSDVNSSPVEFRIDSC